MKILVTGHDGYVGSVLTNMLLQRGHEVAGLDTFFFVGCGLDGREPGEEVAAGGPRTDLRDITLGQLEGFEAVVHLAALSNDPLGNLNPELTSEINERATLRLAYLARSAGIQRFVFASSCSLYGAAGAEGLIDEQAPLRPLTAYGVSKINAENRLSALANDDFSPTFLRAATAYGASRRLRGDVVVNNLVGSALFRGEVRLLSDGKAWRPLIHVEDMSSAFVSVLEAPRVVVHDQAFNLAPDGENYEIRDVAEVVAEALPGCDVVFSAESGSDPRSYRVDGSKLMSLVPEFRPKWTLREGVEQVVSVLDRADLSEPDFFGPRFIRLERLQALLRTGKLEQDLRWRSAPSHQPTDRGAELWDSSRTGSRR
jgi:nucleoside-diphosphate-sugar epimerase